MEGRGPAPFGGGYVPGGGGMYCGAKVKMVSDKLVLNNVIKLTWHLWHRRRSVHSWWKGWLSPTMNRFSLTLCVRWYGWWVGHWLHEGRRYEGTWWRRSHTRHHRLGPAVDSRGSIKDYNFLPVRGSKERK